MWAGIHKLDDPFKEGTSHSLATGQKAKEKTRDAYQKHRDAEESYAKERRQVKDNGANRGKRVVEAEFDALGDSVVKASGSPQWKHKWEQNAYERQYGSDWTEYNRQWTIWQHLGKSAREFVFGESVISDADAALYKKDLELRLNDAKLPGAAELGDKRKNQDQAIQDLKDQFKKGRHGIEPAPKKEDAGPLQEPPEEVKPDNEPPGSEDMSSRGSGSMEQASGEPGAAAANPGNTTTSNEFGSVATIGPITSLSPGPVKTMIYKKRQQFYIPITETTHNDVKVKVVQSGANDKLKTVIYNNGWYKIPYESSAFYMTNADVARLHHYTSKWRPKYCAVKMSNFQMMTGNLSGTGTPTFNQSYGGIQWESVMMDDELLGPHTTCDSQLLTLSYNSIVGLMSKPGGYEQYNIRLGQIMTDGYSDFDSYTDVDPTHVGCVKNLSCYSHVSMGQPYHKEFAMIFPKKHWYNTNFCRPKGILINVAEDGSNIFNTQRSALLQWGINSGTEAILARDSNGNVAVPGACSTITVTNSNVEESWGHFSLINSNNAPIMKFGADSSFTSTYHNDAPMMGNATHLSTKTMAFRLLVPPSVDGSSPNLIASFTIETECEIEYYDHIDTGDFMDGYRHTHIVTNGTVAEVRSTEVAPSEIITNYLACGHYRYTKDRWMNGLTPTDKYSTVGIASDHLSNVPYTTLPGGAVAIGHAAPFAAQQTGATSIAPGGLLFGQSAVNSKQATQALFGPDLGF